MAVQHKDAALTKRHAPHNWEYADATARTGATGFVSGDVGKIARQLDDNSLWMLTDDSPVTWQGVGGGGAGVSSVFARTGAVTAQSGDYTAAHIANTPAGGIAAVTVQNALNELDNEKAPLASPTFTGTPAAPTAAGGTSTTQIATTAFVAAAVSALINSAPGALDTLDELAAALGDDANFAATITAALAGKASLTADNSLSGKQIFGKATVSTPVTLTDAATIATDASLGNRFRVALAGNRTLGNPTNPSDGQQCVWELIQDATGGRTLALDTKFALGADITAVTLTTTANKRDFLTATYNSAADKWYVIGFIKGY